ncbi:hypothetical protein F4860DRAFT_467120 [Xylaria cubensis]|nr:hypothetical protein F4860DRAFT_467120 [Xylaria cubensis]
MIANGQLSATYVDLTLTWYISSHPRRRPSIPGSISSSIVFFLPTQHQPNSPTNTYTMSARIVSTGARSVFAASTTSIATRATARNFHATSRTLADATAALPVRKPVGAFRGGLFGFLLGSTLAGGGVYGYTLRDYKASNELLTEDIYALQAACQRLNTYVKALEEKMDAAERKRK